MPGGLGKVHPFEGATPCNWPSLGNVLPFLFLLSMLQLSKEIIAIEAIKMDDFLFIVFKLCGYGQK
jgi:hypothetical protein